MSISNKTIKNPINLKILLKFQISGKIFQNKQARQIPNYYKIAFLNR